MNATIEFNWHLTYDLGGSAIGRLGKNKYFAVREVENYSLRISATDPKLYHPVELIPTDSFHQKARSLMYRETGAPVREKNFPYVVSIPGFDTDFSLVLRINLCLPNLISIRLSSNADQPFVEDNLLWQRRLSNHPVLETLCKLTSSLVADGIGLDSIKLRLIESRPMMVVRAEQSSRDFNYNSSFKLEDLLIGRASYKTASTVTAAVALKNVEHNAKDGDNNLFLVDKMGWLFYHFTSLKDDKYLKKEAKKKQELYENAVALAELYKGSPGEHVYDTLGWFFLVCASSPYISHYEHTFNSSFSNKMYWKVLLKEFELPVGFDMAIQFNELEYSQNRKIIKSVNNHRYSETEFWKKIVEKIEETSSDFEVRSMIAKSIVLVGDIYMGDNFSNSNNMAGSIGSGSSASDTSIVGNRQNNIFGGADDLKSEIQLLLKALREQADTVDKEVAVESVEKALEAANAGRVEHFNAYLKASGGWVLSVAEKTGVALAAAAIKSALIG